MRPTISAASTLLFPFAPSVAWAAASARLVYVRGPGAEECPGEEALRAAVGTRLGYDPFFAWAPDTLRWIISWAAFGTRNRTEERTFVGISFRQRTRQPQKADEG